MKLTRWTAPVAAASLLALVGCSSATSAGDSDSMTADDLATVRTKVAAAEEVPTKIDQDGAALSTVPPAGVKIAYLNCGVTGCGPSGDAFMAAAKSLDWDATVTTYDPAAPGGAFQQAIDAGNKYIILNSISVNQVKTQLATAKSKGIVVIGTYLGDEPSEETGLSANFWNDDSNRGQGEKVIDWILADSEGDANVLFVNVPLLPSLVVMQDAAEAEMKKHCPGCGIEAMDVSFEQIGSGKVPSAIVTYLQSHPDTNYVALGLGSALFNGLLPALKTAGLSDQVEIVGTSMQQPQAQALAQGEVSAWTATPITVLWAAVDYAARLEVGETPTDDQLKDWQGVQSLLVSDKEVADMIVGLPDGVWYGPEGYEDQYRELWGVN